MFMCSLGDAPNHIFKNKPIVLDIPEFSEEVNVTVGLQSPGGLYHTLWLEVTFSGHSTAERPSVKLYLIHENDVFTNSDPQMMINRGSYLSGVVGCDSAHCHMKADVTLFPLWQNPHDDVRQLALHVTYRYCGEYTGFE